MTTKFVHESLQAIPPAQVFTGTWYIFFEGLLKFTQHTQILVDDHLILLHESFQTVFPSQVFTGWHIPKHVIAYKVGTTKGFSKAFINILPTMQHEVHILHFHENTISHCTVDHAGVY